MEIESNGLMLTGAPITYEVDLAYTELYWQNHAAGLEASKLLLHDTVSLNLAHELIGEKIKNSDLQAKNAKLNLTASILIREKAEALIRLEKMTKMANIDQLTGLVNRRGAKEKYRRLQGNPGPYERRFSGSRPVDSQVIVLDVDNFKQVNDTHGHDVGDTLLTVVGEVMQKNTRSNDIVARWGGDEFVIIMPRAPRERVDDAAEAIRQELKDIHLHKEFKNSQRPVKSSVSIGIGKADLRLTLDQIVAIADKALISAKENGKNVIVHFDDMITPTS